MAKRIKKRRLEPVDIPMMMPAIADDVENADGGIGRLHTTRDFVVHVTYAFPVPVGTTFQLFWHGSTPVGFHLVRPGDPVRTRFPITVSAQSIREPWADPVYCKIIPSNEPPQQTPPLRLRVNLQRPGGKAPEPTAEGNRNLVFELEPEVALAGVSAEKAKVGVRITCRKWQNMGLYDLLKIAWGSEEIKHLVQRNEVGEDINMMVTPEVISAAGNSEMLPVGMTVIGNTGNLPDEDAPWSVITRVAVHADSERRESPWIEFPVTEYKIDLADIGNGAVKIGCYAMDEDTLIYTHMHFFWVGTTVDGFSIPHSETRELTGSRAYYFEVPNGVASAVAKGGAYAYYTLEGPQGTSTRSKFRHAQVEGEVVQWLAPGIEGESDGQIDPERPSANILVPVQAGWASFQELDVKLVAADAGGTREHTINVILGEIPPDETHLAVLLKGDDLRRFKGRVAELFYIATKPDEKPRESLRRLIQVGELEPDMPAPIALDAVEGVLDLSTVTDFGTPVSVPFDDLEFGDWITLFIKGVESFDFPKPVGADGVAISFDVLPQYLTPNVNHDVSLYYTRKRGTLPESYSLTTPLRIISGSRVKSSRARRF